MYTQYMVLLPYDEHVSSTDMYYVHIICIFYMHMMVELTTVRLTNDVRVELLMEDMGNKWIIFDI